MMTLNEAIKHCEEVVAKYEKQAANSMSKEGKEYNCECASDHRQLAEWLRELKAFKATDVQLINGWISVNDRLPELGHRVLVCYHFWADKDKVYQIAYLKETQDDGIQFVTYEGFNLPTVTHWQPLPEPPKQ